MRHRPLGGIVVAIVGMTAGVSGWSATALAEPAGTITGTIRFEGTPPPARPIEFGAEKQCSIGHQHAPQYEDLVVGSGGTIKWVLVYVKEGAPEGGEAPAEPVVYDQRGCIFEPHVAVARVGQPVEFRNNDPVLHNVRGMSKQKQAFNVAQPIQGMKTQRTFKSPEIGMLLKCDVHFWMTSYLHVLPHPYAAVTGNDGRFTISGLPVGTYTIEAWHETLGTQTQVVTVQAGAAATADLSFAGR